MIDELLRAWAQLGALNRAIIAILAIMAFVGTLLFALWFGWEFGQFLYAIGEQ